MPFSHKLLLTVNSCSVGILTPILVLLFCRRGASLDTLWAVMGAFSVSVILFELPSGMIADSIGRKKVFLSAHILALMSFFLMLFSEKLWNLMVSVALLGLSRAFLSGSIEALEVELFIEKHGPEHLNSVNNTLALTDCAGTLLGALAGGYLGFADPSYRLVLLVLILTELFIVTFSACILPKEPARREREARQTVWQSFSSILEEIVQSRSILIIVLLSQTLGITLSTLETYWQPELSYYLPLNAEWLLGVVSCLAYAGAGAGSVIGTFCLGRIKARGKSMQNFYYFTRLLLPVSLAGITVCQSLKSLLVNYVLIYLILGTGNLAERTLLHAAASDGSRASALSCISLAAKAGGLFTALLGLLLSRSAELDMIWILSPAVSVMMVLGIIISSGRERNCGLFGEQRR